MKSVPDQAHLEVISLIGRLHAKRIQIKSALHWVNQFKSQLIECGPDIVAKIVSCENRMDFERLTHAEVKRVMKAFRPAKWKWHSCLAEHQNVIYEHHSRSGLHLWLWSCESPPSVKFIEIEEEIPAGVRKITKRVESGTLAHALAVARESAK